MNQSFTINPIGHVKETPKGFVLDMKEEFAAGLDGLQEFSHALVFWWAHHFDQEQDRKTVYAHPPYNSAPDRLGIFASRSPIRPNPVAMTAVRILDIDSQEGKVEIANIDAEDGTPVIDIKPYHPSADRIRDAKVPQWCSHWPECYEDSAEYDWNSEFNFE